jgi:hypothetical protein
MNNILKYYNEKKESIQNIIDSELKTFLKKFPKVKLKDKIKKKYYL